MLQSGIAMGIDNKKKKLIVPGRWREQVRLKPDSSVQSFSDTLFLQFFAKDSFSFHHGYNFVYEGAYKLSEDSILDMGYARYKVLKRRGDSLVMFNDKGIFFLGVDKSDTSQAVVIVKEDSVLPVTDIDVMIGKWSVYKRQSDGGGRLEASTNIRSVYITGASTDGKQGYVYSGADADNYPSWTVKELAGGQSLVCEGRTPRTFSVLKCQKGELILEADGVKYYLKQPK